MFDPVDRDTGLGHHVRATLLTATLATQQRLDSLQQYFDAKRFRDVVVCANIETNQFVGFLTFGSEHHDWRVAGFRFRSQSTTDFQAIQNRNHQIQNDQVVFVVPCQVYGVFAQPRSIYVDVRALQQERDTVRSVRIVFHEENAHLSPRHIKEKRCELQGLEAFAMPYAALDAVFLSVLTRKPNAAEKEEWLQELQVDANEGIKELIWTLVNSSEFIFIQ